MPINVTISSTVGTFAGGTFQIGPLQIASSFGTVQIVTVLMTSATYIVTPAPVGAYGCLIEPPSGNTVPLTMNGGPTNTGNGVPISGTLPSIVTFGNPSLATNGIGLLSTGGLGGTGLVTLTFF